MNRTTKVYQEHLSKLGHGRALWRPEPSPDEVLIGDVGYIDQDNGSWHLLLNILDPERNRGDLPKNFEPLRKSHKPGHYPNQLQAQIYTSENVLQTSIPNEQPDSPIMTCRYRCVEGTGALLALQEGCENVVVPHNRDWIEYMRRNHRSWHEWATQEEGSPIIDKEDIILVRGYIKARKWAIACFNNTEEVLQVSLRGRVPYGTLGPIPTERQQTSPQTRKSDSFEEQPPRESDLSTVPSPTDPTRPEAKDCIFLQAYRAKYRVLRIVPLILAAADSGHLAEDGSPAPEDVSIVPTSDIGEMEVDMEPECSKKPRLPADRILNLHIPDDIDTVTQNTFVAPQFGLTVNIDTLINDELGEGFPFTMASSGGFDTTKDDMHPNVSSKHDGIDERSCMHHISARWRSAQYCHPVSRVDVTSILNCVDRPFTDASMLPSRGGPYSAVNSPNQYFSAMLEILRQQRALSDGLISSRRHQHCTNAVVEITRLRKMHCSRSYLRIMPFLQPSIIDPQRARVLGPYFHTLRSEMDGEYDKYTDVGRVSEARSLSCLLVV